MQEGRIDGEVTEYPIRPRYSIISCFAAATILPPEALEASMAAAFD